MTLFAEYNSPYLFAIAFVFFIGVLEMISLIFGHFLSGALDAHLDHYDALSSGPAGRGASLSEYWTRSRPSRPLSIGRLFRPLRYPHPAWRDHALAGAAQQSAAGPVKHCPVGLCRALQRKILAPRLPRDESSALREEEFIGGMAIITGHAAVAGTPCEGKFTDKFGQIHYLLLEPEKGKEFKKETRC